MNHVAVQGPLCGPFARREKKSAERTLYGYGLWLPSILAIQAMAKKMAQRIPNPI